MLVSFFLTLGLVGHASPLERPFFCVLNAPVPISELEAPELRPELTKFDCQDLSRIATGLQVASITVDIGSVYMACTGAGIGASVMLEGGSIGLQVLRVIVGNLPCEDNRDARVERLVHQFVCEQLNDEGLSCRE